MDYTDRLKVLEGERKRILESMKSAEKTIKVQQTELAKLKEIEKAIQLDVGSEDDEALGNRVCRQGRLSYTEMAQIASFDENKLFEYLFRGITVYAKGVIDPNRGGWILCPRINLPLLPEFRSQAISALEEQIVKSLKNAVPLSRYENFGKTDMSPYLYQIIHREGKLYAKQDVFVNLTKEEEPNDDNDDLGSVVANLKQIDGRKFFATAFVEPDFFLKYHPNEILKMVPEGSNAYELGETIFRVFVSEDGSFESPFGSKELKGAVLETCDYHVIPIKFYQTDTDKIKQRKK